MVVLSILLAVLLFLLPFFVGNLFKNRSFSFTYFSGQILMWAVFQMVAVVAIHLRTSFTLLFWIYTGLIILLTGIGLQNRLKIKFSKPEISAFLVVALGVIVYQCCIYIFGMHLDEDDARWIAEANDALVKDRMLLYNPATGEYIGRFVGEMIKDAFSPWSMYLAWMSRFTGIRAVDLAHTYYAPVLLILSYMAYYEMGKCLFKGKAERGIFLLMVSVINLFFAGNEYTQSVFTLTRIWQGKAVVAAIMIPGILMMILRIQNEDTLVNWLLLGMIGCAACLFSGMGIAIGLLTIAVYGFYTVCCSMVRRIRNKEIQNKWGGTLVRVGIWVLCMLPSIIFGLGYLRLKG